MNTYDEYVSAHKMGIRERTNELAKKVVLEWEKSKSNELAYQIVREKIGHRVNHILFSGIVFPVIQFGIQRDEINAIRMAIECIQNIYSDKRLWKELGNVTEISLLHKYLELMPNDQWAKMKYLDAMAEWFRYCKHEWPSGILYGHDGATIEECGIILKSIDEARTVDTEGMLSDLLDDIEVKTQAYLIKLRGG